MAAVDKNCTNCAKAREDDDLAGQLHDDCYACFPHAKALGFYPHWEASVDYTKDDTAEDDMVNHPKHYKDGGIETIDYIEAKLGWEGFNAYCVGSAMKYLSRAGKKNIVGDSTGARYLEDVQKASWYLKRLLGEI